MAYFLNYAAYAAPKGIIEIVSYSFEALTSVWIPGAEVYSQPQAIMGGKDVKKALEDWYLDSSKLMKANKKPGW